MDFYGTCLQKHNYNISETGIAHRSETEVTDGCPTDMQLTPEYVQSLSMYNDYYEKQKPSATSLQSLEAFVTKYQPKTTCEYSLWDSISILDVWPPQIRLGWQTTKYNKVSGCVPDALYGIKVTPYDMSSEEDVYGALIGGAVSAGDVYGINLGLATRGESVHGLSVAGWTSQKKDIDGLSLAIATEAKNANGASIGIFQRLGEVNGFGLALANSFKDGSDHHSEGLTVALFNVGGRHKGVQVGLGNVTTSVDGLQIGVMNMTKSGETSSLQVGIINVQNREPYFLIHGQGK